MIAERVWKAKFWNVHQSSFSIPGMRGREKRKELRAASSLNDSTANSETTLPEKPPQHRSPQPAQVCRPLMSGCVCRSMCVLCVCERVCLCIYEWERKWLSVCRWMCVCHGNTRREKRRRDGETREVRGGERTRGVRRQQWDEREDGESMRAVSERNDSFRAWDRAL